MILMVIWFMYGAGEIAAEGFIEKKLNLAH